MLFLNQQVPKKTSITWLHTCRLCQHIKKDVKWVGTRSIYVYLVCVPLTHNDAFTLLWCTDTLVNMSHPFYNPHLSLLHTLSLSHTHGTRILPCRETWLLSPICQCYSWGNGDLAHEWWVLLYECPTPPRIPGSLFMQTTTKKKMSKYTNKMQEKQQRHKIFSK